jgi:hypothetical protein
MPDTPVYTPIYTTYEDLWRVLNANKGAIRVGDEASDHISEDDIRYTLRDAERHVTSLLSKRYVTPLTLADLTDGAKDTIANAVLYRAAYMVWLTIPGTQYQGSMPQVVSEWKTMSAALMADIASGSVPIDGATSRFGDDATLPSFEDRKAVYPESRGESFTVDDEDVGETDGGVVGDILDGSGE